MVAARERYVRRQLEREGYASGDESAAAEDRACEIRARLVALGSDQAHSSTRKAAVVSAIVTPPRTISMRFSTRSSRGGRG